MGSLQFGAFAESHGPVRAIAFTDNIMTYNSFGSPIGIRSLTEIHNIFVAGSLKTINTYDENNITSIDIVNDITSLYDDYIIEGYVEHIDIITNLILRFSVNKGATWFDLENYNNTAIINRQLFYLRGVGGSVIAANVMPFRRINFSIDLKQILVNVPKMIKGTSAYKSSNGFEGDASFIMDSGENSLAIDAVQIRASNGNITGIVNMKGILK